MCCWNLAPEHDTSDESLCISNQQPVRLWGRRLARSRYDISLKMVTADANRSESKALTVEGKVEA
jgi:hypothetical protein